MDIPGITWRGESIDDVEIFRELPPQLRDVLSETNGFIIHKGALHVRGASLQPEWHSLRTAWQGEKAFQSLYDSIRATDVPFAQDQFGDQFLIRDGKIIRLLSETGEVQPFVQSLDVFFSRVRDDIEGFLNVRIDHPVEPGQLLLAYPPFCFEESRAGVSLTPTVAREVILFHLDLAKQLCNIPVGQRVRVRVTE
jgi:hypothetical protein